MPAYLDNAATSHPKPPEVYAAVDAELRLGGGANRAPHAEGMNATRRLYAFRESIAAFLGVRDASRLIFGSSATDAMNLALKGYLRPGDHVVSTDVEHNAVVRPLHALSAAGVRVTYVSAERDGRINPQALAEKFERGTRLAVCTHASNVLGGLNPIAELSQAAAAHGVPLLVDASQTAGHAAVDVAEMGVAMLVASGHKGLLGPQGTGLLYVREDIDLVPWREGGTGTESERPEMPGAFPERLEAGTHNMPGLAGLAAGVRWIQQQGRDVLERQVAQRVDQLLSSLQPVGELQVMSAADARARSNIVTLAAPGYDSQSLAVTLARLGFSVRGGLHCAPGAHRAAGTLAWGALRVSPGVFTTAGDIDDFVSALKTAIKEMAV